MNNYWIQANSRDQYFWLMGFLLHRYHDSNPRKGTGAFVVEFSLDLQDWDEEDWEKWIQVAAEIKQKDISMQGFCFIPSPDHGPLAESTKSHPE